MKNKNSKHHHTTVHVKIERFFRHRTILSVVLSFMALGLIKYQSHMLTVIHELYYGQGVGMLSGYTHHDEVTRMPITYGSNVRNTPISGE